VKEPRVYPLCRSIRMVGDTLITGSDDWTARVWSVSRGTCDAVLACHAGPILCVEYSMSDRGIITGKYLLLCLCCDLIA
jgi:WD40 repeat protein